LPGPLPVRPVLEEGHQSRLLGQLPVLGGGHASQHAGAPAVPGGAPVLHQRRRLLHAGRAGHRAGGLPGDPQAGPETGGRRLLLLRPEGAGAPAGGPGRRRVTSVWSQNGSFWARKFLFKAGLLWYAVPGARFFRTAPFLRERTVSFMVIDIHTHTFPDKLAATTIPKLEGMSHTRAYVDGTVSGLRASMARAGVDASLVLPVATNPRQVVHVNDSSAQINDLGPQTGV